MIETFIVRLEVAVDFVHRLVDLLDRGTQANRILPLKMLASKLTIFKLTA